MIKNMKGCQCIEYLNSLPAIAYNIPVEVPDGEGMVAGNVSSLLGFEAKNPQHFFEIFYNCLHHEDRAIVTAAWDTAREKGTKFSIECRISGRQGSIRYVLNEGVFSKVKGEMRHSGILLDITDRYCREQELKTRETRYRRITESMSDYVFTVLFRDGQVIETTHGGACQPITGYSPQEFHDNPDLWLEMVHEADRHLVEEAAGKMVDGDEVPQLCHRILHKNGQIRWVHSTVVPHRDIAGNLLSYDGVIRDITEQKSEEERRKQELFITEMLLDSMPYPALLVQIDGEVIGVNSAGLEMGARVGESWEKAFSEIGALVTCAPMLQEAINCNSRLNTDVSMAEREYEAVFAPIEPDLCLCSFYDVTDRKNSGCDFAADRLLMQSLFARADCGVTVHDAVGRLLDFNSQAQTLLGLEPEQHKNHYFTDIFPPEEATVFEALLKSAAEQRRECKKRVSWRGGQLEFVAVPVLDQAKTPLKILGFIYDTTYLFNADKRLLETYQTLSQIVDYVPVSVAIVDGAGKVRLWNRHAQQMTGLSPAEMFGQSILQAFDNPPAALCEMIEGVNRSGAAVERQLMTYTLVSGRQCRALVTLAPLCQGEGEGGATLYLSLHLTAELRQAFDD